MRKKPPLTISSPPLGSWFFGQLAVRAESSKLSRALGFLLCIVAGCGSTRGPAAEPELDPLSPRRLYPLQQGNVWSYDARSGESGKPTLAITRVVETEPGFAKVSSSGSQPLTYELRAEGLYRADRGAWVLRAPIRVGSRWPSQGGRTAHVVSVSEEVRTPAGSFSGCVHVRETGGPSGMQIDTVYCPDVGPVLIESHLGPDSNNPPASVRAELRGYQVQGIP